MAEPRPSLHPSLSDGHGTLPYHEVADSLEPIWKLIGSSRSLAASHTGIPVRRAEVGQPVVMRGRGCVDAVEPQLVDPVDLAHRQFDVPEGQDAHGHQALPSDSSCISAMASL